MLHRLKYMEFDSDVGPTCKVKKQQQQQQQQQQKLQLR